MDVRPLAERMRPQTLEQVVGQEQLTAAGQILHEIIEKQQPTSLILVGTARQRQDHASPYYRQPDRRSIHRA
ncbi:MAG: hypothetical protein WDN27_05195 [Candidatus Saccharibacteria bacterium]